MYCVFVQRRVDAIRQFQRNVWQAFAIPGYGGYEGGISRGTRGLPVDY